MAMQKKLHNYVFVWRTLIGSGMVQTTHPQIGLEGILCISATFTDGLSVGDIDLTFLLLLSPGYRWKKKYLQAVHYWGLVEVK